VVFHVDMTAADVLTRAGVHACLHATTLDGRHEVAHGADEPVMPASVFKVLVAVAAETRFADGTLDPRARVRLGPVARTPGPVGLSLLQDEVDLSLRDLVPLMLTVSDNVATDALLAEVGLDAVNALAARLGLDGTRVGCDLRTLIESMAHESGFDSWADLRTWAASVEADDAVVGSRVSGTAALRPDGPLTTTARDMTRLLQLVWTDRAGPAGACGRVRELMGRQLTRHRLAAGFGPDVRVAAKSGGLVGVVRNEIGVVTYPDGMAFAVAVFTRSDDPGADGRPVDRAIGEAAADAVDELRTAVRR
jgi:beta-lactamase class A